MYEDNEKLLKEYQEGNKDLSSVIIENNLGLVNYVLKGFRWAFSDNPNYQNVFDKEDLYQEGVLGLYNSLDNYNSELGSFSTYAISYIKQAIYRFYYDKGRVIRVPIWCRTDYNKLKKAEDKYITMHKKEPSLEQLARFSGMATDTILELKRSFSSVASMDKPIDTADGDINLADSIPDHTDFYTQAERNIIMPELKKDLLRMIHDKIPDKQEAKAFISYFKDEARSITKISEACGMNKGKLNRIINKGLWGIRIKYQDELIEKYADIISSSIRKQREEELMAKGTQKVIHEVLASSLKSGDSLTIINKKSRIMQVTVTQVKPEEIRYEFIHHRRTLGTYEKITSFVWISDIFDYRTEYKKVVEIRVKSFMFY